MRRRSMLSAVLALATTFVARQAFAQEAAPKPPSVLYGVIFGVLFDEAGSVRQLRLMRVFEPRRGTAEPVEVEIPERYIAAVKKMLESPRYRPKADAIKAEEVFAYFFYDPAQPDRADLDPRPKQR